MYKTRLQIIISLATILWINILQSQETSLIVTDKDINYKLVLINPTNFQIKDSKTIIKLDPFYMGTHEVDYPTFNQFFQDEFYSQNDQYDAITRPSSPYLDFTLGMGKDKGHPANSVQHYGAMMFCRWIYEKTGEFYRLPTEAEWEYACYIGETEKNLITEIAWHEGNSEGKYHKSAELKPNKLGIYDLLGNVTEWTMDQYVENYPEFVNKNPNNPLVKTTKKHPHTVKGGSFKDSADQLTCSNRRSTDRIWNRRDPQIPKSKWWNTDAPFVGFRLVKPKNQPKKEEVINFFNEYFKS